MMAKTKEITTSAKIENKFITFLGTYKKLLIIIAVALVVAMLGLWAGISIADKRANTLQLEIDNLQQTYSEWMFMEDKATTEAQSMKESLLADLSQLASKNNKSYPVLKATYLLGLIAFEEGEYTQSLESFLKVAERGKQTYLGSLALFNAGVSSELLNDSVQAIEYYQQLYDYYGSEAAEAPKALFSLARLHESNNNMELAKAVLQQLADEFPASEYAKLAQSRLVVLQ
jgi:tetratricopeptide (TPR) repeat protein